MGEAHPRASHLRAFDADVHSRAAKFRAKRHDWFYLLLSSLEREPWNFWLPVLYCCIIYFFFIGAPGYIYNIHFVNKNTKGPKLPLYSFFFLFPFPLFHLHTLGPGLLPSYFRFSSFLGLSSFLSLSFPTFPVPRWNLDSIRGC